MTKRWFFVLSVVFCSLLSMGLTSSPSTPSVVSDFYNSMKGLSTATTEKQAFELQQKMQFCFLYGATNLVVGVSSGIRVPNDFFQFGYNISKSMNSTLYTQIFKQKAFTTGERLRVSDIKIGASTYAREIDLRKFQNEDIPYIQTLVTRTLTLGNKSLVFKDTVLTKNNLICAFKNGFGQGEDDLETLRAMAARYHSAGQLKKAYMTYEKIASLDTKNANAYYRLGILAFWHGKDCGIPSGLRKSKGKEYMEKAKNLGFGKRAEIVKYDMDHPAII